MTTHPSSPAAPTSWNLHTDSGLTVCVPGRLTSLTTFVLLEQERWFESEFNFVARLLEPHTTALDIGANHGVYTLLMASCLRDGHVWAFEPTTEPRQRLQQSVRENRFESRVSVLPIGLSDRARSAEFSICDESELNSLHTTAAVAVARMETVQLDTLDAVLARHVPHTNIDFIKLDAEGEEAAILIGGADFLSRQSPLIMFEFKHAETVNWSLLQRFEALGYELFRLLPELGLLAPFDPGQPGQEFLLNLFACKPDRQQTLAARSLLARQEDLCSGPIDLSPAEESATLEALARLPFAAVLATPLPSGPNKHYRSALACAAAAHLGAPRGAAERLRLLRRAWAHLHHEPATLGVGLASRLLQVHLLHGLGEQAGAVTKACELLQAWPTAGTITELFMPPLVADLERARHGEPAAWAQQLLAEFVETRRAYSSYFRPSDSAMLRQMLSHPDHSAEVERRYVLNEIRNARSVEPALLSRLPDAAHTRNAPLWRAVLAA